MAENKNDGQDQDKVPGIEQDKSQPEPEGTDELRVFNIPRQPFCNEIWDKVDDQAVEGNGEERNEGKGMKKMRCHLKKALRTCRLIRC